MALPKSVSALKVEHKDPELLVLLQSSFFRVPRFQRSYVWQKQEVEDFSNDLWEGFGEDKTWFIGTLIVAKGDKIGRLGPALDVIDGQQRLTTLFLWLAALRDECRERHIDDLANFIDVTYLQDKSPMAPRGGQSRLTIGDSETNSFFQALTIDGSLTRAPLSGSEERIYQAHDCLRETVAERLASWTTPRESVADLLEWLKDSLHAFVAAAPTVASASKLFDLMNSRGRPLEPSDLLKSYLFYVTNGVATSEWAVIARIFDPLKRDADSIPEIGTFIRHQWFSSNAIPASQSRGAPSLRATQELIRKEQAPNKDSALKYLGQLRSDSEVYVQLARPTQAYWENKSGKGVFEALQGLNLIKVEVFRPLILAVVSRFPYAEQLIFLRSLTSWAFRKKIVTGKLGSGEDERDYFTAAYKVSQGLAHETGEVLKLLVIPDDTRFEQAFRTTNITARTARWVLGCLEDHFEGTGERTTMWDQMTLEHVLPDSPRKLAEWSHFNPEQHRSLRQNIGNLTLLRKVPNERAGNGPFVKKSKAYEQSALEITRRISKETDWTPESIGRRAEWLANAAVKAWPLIQLES